MHVTICKKRAFHVVSGKGNDTMKIVNIFNPFLNVIELYLFL